MFLFKEKRQKVYSDKLDVVMALKQLNSYAQFINLPSIGERCLSGKLLETLRYFSCGASWFSSTLSNKTNILLQYLHSLKFFITVHLQKIKHKIRKCLKFAKLCRLLPLTLIGINLEQIPNVCYYLRHSLAFNLFFYQKHQINAP